MLSQLNPLVAPYTFIDGLPASDKLHPSAARIDLLIDDFEALTVGGDARHR
jgi:hypothetical protein